MNKKMIAAAGAIIAATSVFAVESNNIVGYLQRNAGEVRSPMFGASFVSLNNGGTYKLGELKPDTFNFDNSYVQLLNSDTLAIEGFYGYVTPELAEEIIKEDPSLTPEEQEAIRGWVGWWNELDPNFELGDDKYRANDVKVNNGQAFLGLFPDCDVVNFTSSGSAPLTSTAIQTGGAMSPFFASYIPRAIPLKWVVPSAYDFDQDYIQKLSDADLSLNHMYGYVTAELAEEIIAEDPSLSPEEQETIRGWVGWWDEIDPNFELGDETYRADSTVVNPGDAFLGLIPSRTDMVIQFPESLKKLD